MTDSRGTDLARETAASREEATRARIGRAVARARLVLLWEELWPRLAPLVVLAAVFAILS